ncbi:MAG: rod shape-determining protein MreD [Bacillota bacterium]|jgi:rod shape-determining protein MreD
MKYLANLAVLALLVMVQGTLLPAIIPWLPLAPAFIYLIILSMRLERPYLLGAALWTGLVQDLLLGEMLGLSMLTNFVAMAIAWELKESFVENAVLTCGLRVVAATLVQELLISFVYYVRGLEHGNLLSILQVNAGLNLLSNLGLYLLLLAFLRLRGEGKVSALLEVRQ